MRQFFKFLFASCLGVFLALFLIVGIGALVIGRAASNSTQTVTVKPNSILKITLNNAIPERTNNVEDGSSFNLKNEPILGLHDMVAAIRTAKTDDNIKGIFLDVNSLNVPGYASIETLREALEDFKSSGKFVYAHSKMYSQGSYYLASAADKVYLNPMGMVDFKGPGVIGTFFKNMLDKIGVKMQTTYAGKFKGASEPFRLTEFSDANRAQIRTYLDDTYQEMLNNVSKSRNMSLSKLQLAVDNFEGSSAESALSSGLIDGIRYKDEIKAELRTALGLDGDDKIKTVGLPAYAQSNPTTNDYSIKDKIAVVYAEGTIVDGKGNKGQTGDQKYIDIFEDIRTDDRIKAVVLRVNSGGGSAMASENMWRELSLIKDTGKPVVVSMGDLAASGGYYISCLADSILAEPNTLTGSIGVVFAFPSVHNFMEEKLGITVDSVKTGKYSTNYTTLYDLNEAEMAMFQKRTDDMYDTFLTRVADGRDRDKADIHEIAQGRVWTGKRALEIGLVDRLGDLDDALLVAANMSELEQYRKVEYPKIKDSFQEMIEELTGQSDDGGISTALIKKELGDAALPFEYLKEVQQMQGLQTRLPFVIDIK